MIEEWHPLYNSTDPASPPTLQNKEHALGTFPLGDFR